MRALREAGASLRGVPLRYAPAWGVAAIAAARETWSMPLPGKRWRHVIINTKSSWLHGDPRGFRDRQHRLHSSGDYRNRPPVGEHQGLHGRRIGKAQPAVRIAPELRQLIGNCFVREFAARGHKVLAVAVTNVHAHVLVELPNNILTIRGVVGHVKRVASKAVRAEMPGAIWAAGGAYKRVKDRDHQKNVYKYILYDQGSGAWTWSYTDNSTAGQFSRKRAPKPVATTPRRGTA